VGGWVCEWGVRAFPPTLSLPPTHGHPLFPSRLRARALPIDAAGATTTLDALINGGGGSGDGTYAPTTAVTLPCAELAALTGEREASARAAAEAGAAVAHLEASLEARAAGVDALTAGLEAARVEADALRAGLAAVEERGKGLESGEGGVAVRVPLPSPALPLSSRAYPIDAHKHSHGP
jgi:hypothetical protein